MKEQTRQGVTTVKKPVYSGLFVHGMDDAVLTQTAEMALQGGAPGVSLFSDGAMTADKWKTFWNILDAKSRLP